MKTPTNYKILKLTSARRYLLKIVTSLQEIDDGQEDDYIIFDLLNLADRLEQHVKNLQKKN
jgi:hypothetical protein